ncbi:MAG: glycerate kinase [Verrucomicrobium sp.]|nr:glycerate kinase [Verrucomicrobium sp.]
MAPRLLIAPDKFKGSLGAWDVARALEAGFRSVWPEAACRLLPIADGGEGTAEVFGRAMQGFLEEIETVDALGRPCVALVARCGSLAVVDMAAAAGLAQIEPERRDPWTASTYGVGIVLRELAARGAARIFVGLGGSATNDAGLGMAAALGWRFLDGEGREVEPVPRAFDRIATIVPSPFPAAVTGLCDVTNPLLGPDGASHVYGPQKGLKDPEAMDGTLTRLAGKVAAVLGRDERDRPRAGAAGGLGYGLASFCNATLADGFQTVAETLGLEDAIREADWVVTGEGALDRQTVLFGKGPAGVARMARRHGKTVHAFCGVSTAEAGDLFDAIHPLVDGTVTPQESLARPAYYLERKAASVARAG